MRRTLITAAVTLSVMLIVALLPVHRVIGEDMAPSILPGDLVWIIPGLEVRTGDVVALRDPLDSSKTILRRALATTEQIFSYTDGQIRVNKRSLRKQSMGDMGPHQVTQETAWAKAPLKGNQWLTRSVTDPPVYWSSESIPVPANSWFLMADDRDHAMDSRWWGSIHSSDIQGVVRLRWGPAHTWRTSFEWMMGAPPIGD
jgi:signal peptidase I